MDFDTGTAMARAVVARLRTAGCVFAEEEARLLVEAAGSTTDLETLVERRTDGMPLEQAVGWAEFGGLRIMVDPGVFVPRRRTELLAREALALTRSGDVAVELCCGAGPVATFLTAAVPGLVVYAVDVDPAAVACARRNLPGAHVEVGDLYDALPESLHDGVDVLVCNAPYVPTAAIVLLPAEARLHEAAIALDGGPDGLEVLRRAVSGASRWLAPRGTLLMESTIEQADLLIDAITSHGLAGRIVTDDEHDATVVVAHRAA